jgi:hypothetical protein
VRTCLRSVACSISAKAASSLPADRYASVGDLIADVARYQAGERVEAMPEGALLWLERFYRKYKAAVWLIGAYAVLRVGFEMVRAWMRSRGS